MAIFPTTLDYSDKDFDALKARLIAILPSVFPNWTEFEVASFGNVMIEMFCFVGDALTYYQDNNANEAFIGTAQQRKNLIALAKLIGFVPRGRSAATVDLVITLPSPPIDDVIFDEGTIARTVGLSTPVSFRLLSTEQINALQDPPTVTVTTENSEEHTQQFVSTQLPNQEVVLTSIPFIEISVLSADNGIYTKVDNFLRSRNDDRHYVVIVDQNDRATVRFGNGVNGEIPTGTVIIDYTTGGGAQGNVAENTITKLVGVFTDESSNPVFPAVTNPAASDGGEDRQSNESIRNEAPLSLRTLTRTVAREDYEIAAITKTSVVRALMLTSDQDPAIQENSGFLYVIPPGGGLPSQALKDEVAAIFETRFEDGGLPKTITFKLTVSDPQYKELNIFAVVYLEPDAFPSLVRDAIIAALVALFAVTNEDGSINEEVDFGYNLALNLGASASEIPLSRVQSVIDTVTGVRKVGDGLTEFTINGVHSDVSLALQEFPRLGSITLIDGATGDPLGG